MENKVVADVEIEDIQIVHYDSILIRQGFNEHHEFIIRVNYDVLETYGTFGINKAKDLIGKSVIIRLRKIAESSEVAYEFRGIVCEIGLEQSHGFHGDLVIKGFSPTIVLDSGAHLTSFYKRNLKQIVQKITKPLADNGCTVNVNPQYSKEITYICQYKESTFHFLNRLSADFGDWCYYDGKAYNFGKPSSFPEIALTYGEEISSIQLHLRLVPMNFSNYSYVSKEDNFLSVTAPQKVNGLDSFASFALDKSNQVFAEPVNLPVSQRVQNKSDLEDFVMQQKAAKAADLELLSGRTDNPSLCIGAIINVSISKKETSGFVKEDYGKFLVISANHFMTENGKYYNTFEAIPSGVEVIPVRNITPPVAESQIATVMDHKDPDKMGRVRVQMLWQQGNEMTDWIRVMTPDAGGGKEGAKNRGLVCIPEKGDKVLVFFRYNDPDRPFVMGSLFHGKTGGGGGEDNKNKSLTVLSGSTISLHGDAITIVDAKGNTIDIDGTGNITISCSASIALACGGGENKPPASFIGLDKDGKIVIHGKEITLVGSDKVDLFSGSEAGGSGLGIVPNNINMVAKEKCGISGGNEANIGSPLLKLFGDTTNMSGQSISVNGNGDVKITGGLVKINS